jgi:hypothetical protein
MTDKPPPDRNSRFANFGTRHPAIVADELESCRYPIARRLFADRCNQGFGKLYGPVLDLGAPYLEFIELNVGRKNVYDAGKVKVLNWVGPNS